MRPRAPAPSSHVSPTQGSTVWWLGAGLALLLTVRVVALRFNATELFFDEAQYWSWAQEPAFGYYSKPPLIAWIIAAFGHACGDSTFCIRLAAPVLHTVTAGVTFLIGRRLAGDRIGLWAALTFATLPGVSFSSGIISTDVPLLACWALALWAFVVLLEEPGWWPSLVLGGAIGIGLNAKYAMAFFVASMLVYMVVTPSARRLLVDLRFWTALVIAGLAIAPNMAWNLSNSFATFAHTADNAKWGGSLLSIAKGFEFLGGQLGVFGPILFGALVATVWRAWRDGLPDAERLLLSFTLPVLMLISVQAFISRAHANWAATAYVAGTLLVVAALARQAAWVWLKASLALHLGVLVAMAGATAAAGRFALPVIGDPFQRTLGWKAVADATRQEIARARAAGQPYRSVLADDRAITAELLYYMRGEATPVLAWRESGRPKDHYELMRPFRDASQEPVLLVSMRRDHARITGRFDRVDGVADLQVPAGLTAKRPVRLLALSGFRAH